MSNPPKLPILAALKAASESELADVRDQIKVTETKLYILLKAEEVLVATLYGKPAKSARTKATSAGKRAAPTLAERMQDHLASVGRPVPWSALETALGVTRQAMQVAAGKCDRFIVEDVMIRIAKMGDRRDAP